MPEGSCLTKPGRVGDGSGPGASGALRWVVSLCGRYVPTLGGGTVWGSIWGQSWTVRVSEGQLVCLGDSWRDWVCVTPELRVSREAWPY